MRHLSDDCEIALAVRAAAARAAGISENWLSSSRRGTKPVCRARHAAMFVAAETCGCSPYRIHDVFGRTAHGVGMARLNVRAALASGDAALARLVADITALAVAAGCPARGLRRTGRQPDRKRARDAAAGLERGSAACSEGAPQPQPPVVAKPVVPFVPVPRMSSGWRDEAKKLRDRGWSVKGLAKRFGKPERDIARLVGAPWEVEKW